jgi:hypothetical protein
MPKTTGWKGLDLAEEVSAIEQSLTMSSTFKAKVFNTPSKDKVLEELKVSRVVHFCLPWSVDSRGSIKQLSSPQERPRWQPATVGRSRAGQNILPTSTTGLSIRSPPSTGSSVINQGPAERGVPT